MKKEKEKKLGCSCGAPQRKRKSIQLLTVKN